LNNLVKFHDYFCIIFETGRLICCTIFTSRTSFR